MTPDSECTGDELLTRMRAAIDCKTFDCEGGNGWHYLMARAIAEIEAVRVERDRCRMALEEILKIDEIEAGPSFNGALDIAETALKGGE